MILYINCQTVGKVFSFDELSDDDQILFQNKLSFNEKSELWLKECSLYPEFSKIITITIGYINSKNELKTKQLKGDEKVILNDLFEILQKNDYTLCGLKVKSWLIPYLYRKYIYNNLPIPKTILSFLNSKPWEIKHIDIYEMMGLNYNTPITLDLILKNCNLPYNLTKLSGSDIHTTYYLSPDEHDKIYDKSEYVIKSIDRIFNYLNSF